VLIPENSQETHASFSPWSVSGLAIKSICLLKLNNQLVAPGGIHCLQGEGEHWLVFFPDEISGKTYVYVTLA